MNQKNKECNASGMFINFLIRNLCNYHIFLMNKYNSVFYADVSMTQNCYDKSSYVIHMGFFILHSSSLKATSNHNEY